MPEMMPKQKMTSYLEYWHFCCDIHTPVTFIGAFDQLSVGGKEITIEFVHFNATVSELNGG